jgi:2-oxoglutarate ferredoxin oxidoreductase subunit beta
MLDPKKLEKTLVKGFQHKGFSFFDVFSNCHVNLGRKNKMESAMKTLDWIDSITASKTKWEKLSPEEQMNTFATGVLKQDEAAKEYCDMYKEIQAVHQGKRKALTQNDFAKKI